MSYPASDETQKQTPGLSDDTVEKGTESLDRSEDREIGLGSNPGITDEATTEAQQGLDQATKGTTSAATGEEGSKGVGQQISETVSGVVNSISESVK